jgi:DNA-binding NtrC family response regulator
VRGLLGDYSKAVELTRRASGYAAEAGWAKGQAMTAANLAYFFVMMGREAEAQEQLTTLPSQYADQPAYRAAIAETLAQAEFVRMEFQRAQDILEGAQSLELPNLRWYNLSSHITRSQILLAKGDWAKASECASTGLALAEQIGNQGAGIALRLCRAEAIASSGHSVSPADLQIELHECTSAELLASKYIARGKAFDAAGDDEAAVEHTSRGARILQAIGSASGRVRAQILGAASSVEATHASLDAAVALLELAGHPHILGREALALLRGSACAEAAALVSATAAATRIVESVGWSDAQATAAAASPADGIERLTVGRRGEETWTLIVRPKRELEPFCTYAAVRKLLAIALSLDGYRRDEKQRAALWPADALDGDPEAIWVSEQMHETLAIARRVAPTPISVLITGETGTGKEMLARAIHRASDRADRVFLPFNCTAVPREMLDSQLFGHRKGAFTGADSAFAGVIRAAAGGTLFLDEIAELGPAVQPKLLRFLESREIHPLGEPHPVTVDVRIVAATNASIEQMVADGRFREDLFYRLNIVRLTLPPLRERREEIPPLVQLYLRKYGDEYKKGRLTLGDDTLEYLLLFPWPGNVRQLANEVRRMVALADPDATLTPAMLSPEIQASRRTIPATPTLDQEVRVALDQPLPAAVEMLEQLMVRRALDRAHGRVEEASRLLGISRKGLFLKRRRWGLGHAS